jgi:fatty acid desaturase
MTPFEQYAKVLREELGAVVYRPAAVRMLWLPVHLSVIGMSIAALLGAEIGLAWRLLLAVVIGHSYACLAFLAHEILHGSVIRHRWLQDLCGGVCFLPHCLPPGVWRTWHNRFHHGHTGKRGLDPDAFGDPVLYRRSRLLHTLLTFLPGSGFVRSAFYFLFYFSAHMLFVLFFHSRRYRYWTARRRRFQIGVFAAMAAFWVGVLLLVGWRNYLFIHLLPLIVTNSVQMLYVTTNHWLCDETPRENDPLRNSLSVKLPRAIDWLHLNVSYHVEHHLAPRVSPRYAPRIHRVMSARYGRRCRRLSLLQILWMTYATPRVHLSENELVDLRTGDVHSTLGPRGEAPARVGPDRRRQAIEIDLPLPPQLVESRRAA